MEKFDPGAAGSWKDGIYGLPFTAEESRCVIVPVPWEATTSYGGGTSKGPQAVLEASEQVDLYDLELGRIYEPGIHLLPVPEDVSRWSVEGRTHAGRARDDDREASRKEVNSLGVRLNDWVFGQSLKWMKAGKILGILGGDHSVPFGGFQATAQIHGEFGILHLDAHSDTRRGYEGFDWSHASIMHNALTHIPQVKRITQVGIRDFSEGEREFIRSQGDRLKVFFDLDLKAAAYGGETWTETCRKIVATLPDKVWLSFDIDGLNPQWCPHTGTPVPGGLDYNQVLHLLSAVGRSGKKIVGFDLNEVAPGPDDEWDANVGARLLYKMAGWAMASQGLIKARD